MPSGLLDQTYPFTAVVGQERMKLALVLNAVNPHLCGVLIRGQKGTAKSTVVRALARLLPETDVVEGCRFGCSPDSPIHWCTECQERGPRGRARRRPRLETLPLGITEDRLVGTIDIERAIQKGEKHFEPGLLARVNRGILYVDEVNLLEDHIVDILLDSAAMGVNVVEREGVSYTHPAQFILVGTMNPEEGELRPQLLDRFGLCVEVGSVGIVAERAEIVSRRLDYERDPRAFCERWEVEERALTKAIAAARKRIAQVALEAKLFETAARLSLKVGVDGHRADILTVKTAATIAAFEGRASVETADIERAAELVYPHRLKRQPFEERSIGEPELRAAVREAAAEGAGSVKKKPAWQAR